MLTGSNCLVCSIDATTESNRLGRLANHSRKATAFVRVVTDGAAPPTPHLCLFAARDLEAGEQILYDYGVKVPFPDLVCMLIFCMFLPN